MMTATVMRSERDVAEVQAILNRMSESGQDQRNLSVRVAGTEPAVSRAVDRQCEP